MEDVKKSTKSCETDQQKKTNKQIIRNDFVFRKTQKSMHLNLILRIPPTWYTSTNINTYMYIFSGYIFNCI